MDNEKPSHFQDIMGIDAEMNEGELSTAVKYIERNFGVKPNTDKRSRDYVDFFNQPTKPQ